MDKLRCALTGLSWGIVACAFISLLWGCASPKTVEVPVVVERAVHDTVRSVTWKSDTLIIRDTTRIMGDTVYHSVWRDRVRAWRDTLMVSRVDTVPRIVTVTETVTEYRSPWYAKAACVIVCVGMMGMVVLLIVKQCSKGE